MWRPEVIGDVIAERSFDLRRGAKRLGRVTVRFGRPIREPKPDASAPWFCPVSISGAGLRFFTAVAGVDSLQALILALELATTIVPSEAARIGAQVEWLGDDERLIFARHTIALGADNALTALLGRLKQASAILDVGTTSSTSAKTRAIQALNAIGASVGGRIASKRPGGKSRTPR
jgi:hypothetical protein